MHEASIILNVLDIARQNCEKEGYSRIDSVSLRIGRAAGVMPDALYFAFEAFKGDTLASEATLKIEEVPVGGTCKKCGGDFTAEEKYLFSCPLCGSENIEIKSGRELDIVELEVSE